MPARNRRSFSTIGISRSAFGNTGPSSGCSRQRTAMYTMNNPAIINPGIKPASHNCPTGWRAIIAYSTSTTEGGTSIPSDEPAWITPVTMRLSYPLRSNSGSAMVAPIAMPATDNPFIAETSTINPIVPIANPPCIPPIHT